MNGDTAKAPDSQNNVEKKTSQAVPGKKPKNCAEEFVQPPPKRDFTTFCGLKNQGATCYLNSLLQSVYMIPEFRNAILNLPLCAEDDLKQPSNFVSQSKFNFLFPLQKLFADLKALDVKATVTEQVTNAFGWNNNEQSQQHDIQEAYRIIFDVLERALEGTAYGHTITKNFRGVQVSHIECLGCGNVKQKESDFYDLILPVKDIGSLEESLLSMLNMDKLEGTNQYACDSCNKKADALKGILVRKYPPILTFSLSRFDFDFQKLQRVKLDHKFTFGLELDVSMFVEKPETYTSDDEKTYELFAVLIHRGDAFGGHYKAYIRDVLKEGDWGGLMAKRAQKKGQGESKGDEQKNTGEQKSEVGAGEKKADEAPKNTLTPEEERKMLEDLANKETTDEEEEEEVKATSNKSTAKSSKKAGKVSKGKKKKNNRKRNRTGHKKRAKGEEEEADVYDDTIYDEVEYPFPFKNQDLKNGWFEFDDSNVNAIPMKRIQYQFGGTPENAYILIYRQKTLNKNLEAQTTKLKPYLHKDIDERNVMLENERKFYAEAEKNIECLFVPSTNVDLDTRMFKPDPNASSKGKKIRIRLDSNIEKLLAEVAENFPELEAKAEEIVIIEVVELGNKLLQFKREIHADLKDVAITDAKIEHLSTFVVFPSRKDEGYNVIASKISEDSVPIRVNARYLGKDIRFLTFKNEPFVNLRIRFHEFFEVPLNLQYIVLMKDSGPQSINKDLTNDERDLASLGIDDNADIIVSRLEESQKSELNSGKRSRHGSKQEKWQEEKLLNSKTENLTPVLVETENKPEPMRYYVDLNWKLSDLVENIKKKLDINFTAQKRLRRLPENTVFCGEELELTLRQLSFEGGNVKLKLEDGEFPQYGKMTIKILNHTNLKKPEGCKDEEDIFCTPNELISEL